MFEIDRVCLFVFLLSGEDGRDNWAIISRTKNVAEGVRKQFFSQIPLLVRLIEVFVVEKSIEDKHGDAMARYRTDI